MFWEGDSSVLQREGIFSSVHKTSHQNQFGTPTQGLSICVFVFAHFLLGGSMGAFGYFFGSHFDFSLAHCHQDIKIILVAFKSKRGKLWSVFPLWSWKQVLNQRSCERKQGEAGWGCHIRKNTSKNLEPQKPKPPFHGKKKHHAFNRGEKSERGFYSVRNPAWLGIIEGAWLQPLHHRGRFPPCPPHFFSEINNCGIPSQVL